MDASVLILLSTVWLVGLVHGGSFSTRRCLYYNKQCVDHCPRGFHPYHTRCDGQTMSQRTCTSPETFVIGFTCGWSRCDCNGNLALNEDLGYCVDFQECPRSLPRRKPRRRRRRRKQHRLPKVKKQDLRPDPDLEHIRTESRG